VSTLYSSYYQSVKKATVGRRQPLHFILIALGKGIYASCVKFSRCLTLFYRQIDKDLSIKSKVSKIKWYIFAWFY